MQTYTKSLKSKVLADLHAIFGINYESGDMEITQCLMNSLMEHHGIKIKELSAIDPENFIPDTSNMEFSFYEAINSVASMQLPYFCYVCESWLDFSEVIRNNGNYEVVALAGTSKMLLELDAKKAVESGDFSGDNVFNAIAAITRPLNTIINDDYASKRA